MKDPNPYSNPDSISLFCKNGGIVMDQENFIKYKHEKIVLEQVRQMDIHKWISSEKCGYDRKDEALFEWINKYAKDFRIFAESIPYTCVHCGNCNGNIEQTCPNPFNEKRIEHLKKEKCLSVTHP
jgi:hypothetical protein